MYNNKKSQFQNALDPTPDQRPLAGTGLTESLDWFEEFNY